MLELRIFSGKYDDLLGQCNMNLGSYFSSLRFAMVMAMVILHLSSLRSYFTCPCKFCPGAALMRETKNLFPVFGHFFFPQCAAWHSNEPTLLAFSFLISFFVCPLNQRSNVPYLKHGQTEMFLFQQGFD